MIVKWPPGSRTMKRLVAVGAIVAALLVALHAIARSNFRPNLGGEVIAVDARRVRLGTARSDAQPQAKHGCEKSVNQAK